MEFKPFPKIERIGKVNMQITQKIHGTNAQVYISMADVIFFRDEFEYEEGAIKVDGEYYILRCGSRTRWIVPGDDNYGFAAFIYANAEEFIRCLGPGQHFGEWAGLGVNSSEGLTDKKFVLFDHWKFPPERKLPPQTVVVPVLYEGPMSLEKIEEVMNDLKINGSKLSPGFMRPEGIVVTMAGTRYKKVFQAEETSWKKGNDNYAKIRDANNVTENKKAMEMFSHLFQPVRLEKLLSRDERYMINFPSSLPLIVTDYYNDLIEEKQLEGFDPVSVKREVNGILYKFIREQCESAING